METKEKEELTLVSREAVLNEIGIKSEVELAENKSFLRLLGLTDRIDLKILEKMLPSIPNITSLIKQNQDFILNGIKEQKEVTIKTIDSFNKTKDIIAENLRKDNLTSEQMMEFIKMLDKTDDRVEDTQNKTLNTIKEYMQKGIKYGGFVALGVLAVVVKSGLDKNKE
jgi:nicotinate-nucleotide pyrophosphorylase